jgi:hypothetical protein
MIVAWHEVPGKNHPPRELSRRYDQVPVHACANQTVPYGTALGVALPQALRARLRSHRPSGTKAIRLAKGLALS